MQYHPDRFINEEQSKEEAEETTDMYLKVKAAYDVLQSGVRVGDKSWYESLGGKERTEFVGPIELTSIAKAQDELASKDIKVAVADIEPSVVQTFVTRIQA
mmetsp:Transcript_26573/g.40793  ORF Transcript_26573/g.40793 Transcript_26573/m.40793 type:complete len:101 (-) Transcript_26573:100-402(-)